MSTELIKVDFSSDRLLVSARELHGFLEVGADYRHWFPRMCEYGFTEGVDFNPVKIDRVQQEGNRTVTRQIDDAALTIDMAKELCMIQRNEKGKQARQYFLQLERDWNSPEKVMARALKIADQKINALTESNRALTEQIERDAPKVQFADAVSASPDSILIGEMAKLLKKNGVDTGEKRLFAWMRENGYLIKRVARDRNTPTQWAVEQGYLTVKEVTFKRLGKDAVKITPLVTGKGQRHLLALFAGNVHPFTTAEQSDMFEVIPA